MEKRSPARALLFQLSSAVLAGMAGGLLSFALAAVLFPDRATDNPVLLLLAVLVPLSGAAGFLAARAFWRKQTGSSS